LAVVPLPPLLYNHWVRMTGLGLFFQPRVKGDKAGVTRMGEIGFVFSDRTGEIRHATYDIRILDMDFDGLCEFLKLFVRFFAFL